MYASNEWANSLMGWRFSAVSAEITANARSSQYVVRPIKCDGSALTPPRSKALVAPRRLLNRSNPTIRRTRSIARPTPHATAQPSSRIISIASTFGNSASVRSLRLINGASRAVSQNSRIPLLLRYRRLVPTLDEIRLLPLEALGQQFDAVFRFHGGQRLRFQDK